MMWEAPGYSYGQKAKETVTKHGDSRLRRGGLKASVRAVVRQGGQRALTASQAPAPGRPGCE